MNCKNEIFGAVSFTENCELRKLLTSSLSDRPNDINDIEFNYYTPEQLNNLVKRCNNNNLSIFHINIRSLNANHDKLCAVLSCCSFKFNVFVFSEVWSTNILFLCSIFDDYEFFYDLPIHMKAGGVGIFVKRDCNPILRNEFKSSNNGCSTFEHIWIEITINNNKYYVGGYYRHPNTSNK